MDLTRDSKSVIVSNTFGDLKRFFCTCGYDRYANQNSMACPLCGKEAEINLIHDEYAVISFLNKEKENDEQISFQYLMYVYRNPNFVSESNQLKLERLKFTFKKLNYSFVIDKKTGDCTLIQGKNSEKISIDLDVRTELYFKFQEYTEYDLETQKNFIDMLLLSRGIYDISSIEFINRDFDKIFIYLKYPSLQYLSKFEIKFPIKEEYFEKIKNSKGKIELFHSLIGHRSKKVLKKIDHTAMFNFLILWGNEIKQPENLINFINEICSDASRLRLFDFSIRNEFSAGVSLIKRLHDGQSEKIWLNRLIKTLKGQYRYTTMQMINSYVEDIGRMYLALKANDPDYTVPFDGCIRLLHDELSKDQRKLNLTNVKIPYDESEKSLEKNIGDNKNFVLAHDVFELLDIGAKMHICVGSYHEKALYKNCNIVILKEEEQPLVCLELQKNKLVQAKIKYNERPIGVYREDVINWCNENKIRYEFCSDI
jgi:hypothetical protein